MTNGRRQRLAWMIVLVSFFSCLSLTIAIPLGLNTFYQRATRPLVILVQANQGTVGIIEGENRTGALFEGEPALTLTPGGTILTNADDTALILIYSPDGAELLGRIQVYGSTNVTVEKAVAPRFQGSSSRTDLRIRLVGGRVHITLPELVKENFLLQVLASQGVISTQESGQYSFTALERDTQVAVIQGQATIASPSQSLDLQADERAILSIDGSVAGPLDTERTMLRNGDFSQALSQWSLLPPAIEIEGQPTVETKVVAVSDEPTLQFSRVGIGHAEVGLRQIINQDVTDYQSLRLALSMRIVDQSLGVCGQQGSECPLFVRIEYVDANGVDQTWQQGFFAVGEIGQGTPDICVTCAPPYNEHQKVNFDQIVFFDSDNLLEQLTILDILPRHIKAITLVASGHSFETQILDVALIARE